MEADSFLSPGHLILLQHTNLAPCNRNR
uniref:Uncharacterized protein n=1 Tax=Anguilla anguilla TaxID=7936 RepID=A0A0E9Q4D5_ANGAN